MPKGIIACRVSSYGPFQRIAYEHLAGLGIRYVEIEAPRAKELARTQAALARFDLSVSSLHCQCDVSRPDTAAQVEAQMPILAALGARYMFVSVRAGRTPLPTAYARLREAGDVAAAHGVTIVMETHPDLITNASAALATMHGVSHSSVRINYDTANIYFYNQNVDAADELARIVPYVASLHLKETDGGYQSWNFPALGRGIVPFERVFEILDAAGFSGPCTLEIEGIEGETKTERLVCDRVAESLGFLRGLGRLR